MVGRIQIPPDKSISHRALIFNGFANGLATIDNLLASDDINATATCLKSLGVKINGREIRGCAGRLTSPERPLDCGNSGTTFRLLLGLLAGQPFHSDLRGDESLHRRPMSRVTTPLRQFGVGFEGPSDGKTAPLTIMGGALKNKRIYSPVASAQVKTAMMLAGIQGEGTMYFSQPAGSRDHTERMFRTMGIVFEDWVDKSGTHFIQLDGPQQLKSVDIKVPGDISSAAFFIVAATIIPHSDLLIPTVGLNPTRTGLIDALLAMGASIDISNRHLVSGEPVGDIRVRYAPLCGTVVGGSLVTRMIDEIPIFTIAAAVASGTTTVNDASELRVKESDRFEASLSLARGLGASTTTIGDGFKIDGVTETTTLPIAVDANNDHRLAMAGTIAGLVHQGGASISGIESIQSSFPSFLQKIGSLCD
jgi:3-phosphoshikimate 1-carboxyvinyltransferase